MRSSPATVIGLKVAAPRLPGALALLVLGLAASIVLGLGDRGVTLIGEVPRGLPSIAIPELDFVGATVPAADGRAEVEVAPSPAGSR